jgi:hypothetical protein
MGRGGMTGDKPVLITFPPYDAGTTDIRSGGKRVGIAVAEFKGWRAYLVPEATDRRIRKGGEEEVTARTLGELRRVLRERVELKGPWWTA